MVEIRVVDCTKILLSLSEGLYEDCTRGNVYFGARVQRTLTVKHRCDS